MKRACILSICAVSIALITALDIPAFAEKNPDIDVTIIDRRDHSTAYTYVIPGSSTTDSRTNLNCTGNTNNINCSGSTQGTSSNTPATTLSYQVSGATFSLRLPDGRVAIVNCDSRRPPTGVAITVALAGGGALKKRNCRMPLVNNIRAEFSGDTAKLKWPVSVDGKKVEVETYKILGVIPRP